MEAAPHGQLCWVSDEHLARSIFRVPFSVVSSCGSMHTCTDEERFHAPGIEEPLDVKYCSISWGYVGGAVAASLVALYVARSALHRAGFSFHQQPPSRPPESRSYFERPRPF